MCRGLWNRETVPYQEGDRRRQIRFLDPDAGLINLRDQIPVYVAGSGPKSLELAGEIGDGVILFGVVGDSLLEYTLGHVRRGAERAGKRAPGPLYRGCDRVPSDANPAKALLIFSARWGL